MALQTSHAAAVQRRRRERCSFTSYYCTKGQRVVGDANPALITTWMSKLKTHLSFGCRARGEQTEKKKKEEFKVGAKYMRIILAVGMPQHNRNNWISFY